MLDFKSLKRAFWQWENVVFLGKGKEWLINKEDQFSSKFWSWIYLPLKFTMAGLLTQTGKVLFLHLLFTWWWLKQNGLTAKLKNSNLSNSIWENKQLQNGNYQVYFLSRTPGNNIDIDLTFHKNITKLCFSAKKKLYTLACASIVMI